MKAFLKKSVMQKIIICIILILVVNFTLTPYQVQADITDPHEIEAVGILVKYIVLFINLLGDGVMFLMQICIGGDFSNYWSTRHVDPQSRHTDGVNFWYGGGDTDILYPAYIFLTPEAIFSNKILILTGNFISKIDATDKFGSDSTESGLKVLRDNIAKWYIGLRNLALVLLLSILVYIAIRIILTSVASEKAKYKQMIGYWVTAVCLLFILHYIMLFVFTINDLLVDAIGNRNGGVISTQSVTSKEDEDNKYKGRQLNIKGDWKDKYQEFLDRYYPDIDQSKMFDGDSIIGFTSLTQYARLYAQIVGGVGLSYCVIYVCLIGYTVYFFIRYIKRTIYLAFLTMIAPLIAVTYPIDKLNDGQSQAFNTWIREFLFNVLLQPLHLIMYTVLIGSAIELANSNMIYTIVALGFLLPAEKVLRKMFGFDKASTNSAFSGAAAGSLVANAISKVGKKGASSKNNSNSNNSSNNETNNSRIPTRENPYQIYEDQNNQQQPGERKNIQNRQLPDRNTDTNTNTNTVDNTDSRQKMLDLYDEKFGTPDWDPQERDAMARELNNPNESMYNEEEREKIYENNLRDSGYNEDEIQKEMNKYREENSQDKQKSTTKENPQLQSTRKTEKKPKSRFIAKTGKGVKTIGRTVLGGIKNKVGYVNGESKKRNALNIAKKVGKTAIRGAITLGSGTTGALLAGSAALISGDPTKVLSAAVLGGKSAMNVGKRINKTLSSAGETFKRGYLGNEYLSQQNQTRDSQWANSRETINDYTAEFGSKNARRAIEEGKEIREITGVEDNIKIKKALSMTEEFGGEKMKGNPEALTLQEAKNMPLLDKEVSDKAFESTKNYTEEKNKIQKELVNKGVNTTLAKEGAEKALRQVAKFRGVKVPVANEDTKNKQHEQESISDVMISENSSKKTGRNLSRINNTKKSRKGNNTNLATTKKSKK